MACSRGNDRPVADSPTSPTAVAAAANHGYMSVGVINSPMVVPFPGRDQSFMFRNSLETKYRTGLGRSGNTTFVDIEGEIVWIQEYLRYRVNGCDHATALSRVLAQIDGAIGGPVCSEVDPGADVPFPARTDVFEARRSLDTKYQQMGRGLSVTAVDIEGAGIWIAEYLRYRASGCDHATAEQKVFAQIDGAAPPATCFVPCSYTLNPGGISTGSGASTQSFEVRPPSASSPRCGWTASSTVPWLTFDSSQTPNQGFAVFTYSIAQNNGNRRTGHIDVAWQGGGARYTVDQAGTPFAASFTMIDPFQSANPTDTCQFRSTSTPCNFTATANLPGGGAYTYQWEATYFYGTQKTTTQFNNSNTFTITDACGGPGSASDGPGTGLNVSVTITDSLGNTITLRSGEGNQPSLSVRLFSC